MLAKSGQNIGSGGNLSAAWTTSELAGLGSTFRAPDGAKRECKEDALHHEQLTKNTCFIRIGCVLRPKFLHWITRFNFCENCASAAGARKPRCAARRSTEGQHTAMRWIHAAHADAHGVDRSPEGMAAFQRIAATGVVVSPPLVGLAAGPTCR